jgi:hypothetical protein
MIGGALILILIGISLGVLGWLLLRGTRGGWRIGRLLAAAPQRSLSEAAAIAAGGDPAYVRLHGRINSDEEFPGEAGVPVVFRRRRLQRESGSRFWKSVGWHTFDDERLAVPFGLSERGEQVAIDTDALGDGLVVIPRISEGVASDLTAEAVTERTPEMPGDTPVRLRIEQVSSVDHGTAAGVPQLGPDGEVVLGPGLGRPLVLTTLELDEAMRVLAADRRSSLLLASGLLVAAPIVMVVGLLVALLGL